MKLSGRAVVAALALAIGMAGNARAGEGTIVTAPEYLEYLTEIREGLKEGYPKPLSKREQRIFDEAETSLRRNLAGKGDISELRGETAAEVYAAQQTIIAILSGDEEERVMCRREGRVGTNFRQTRCVSLDTQRKERENSQHVFRNLPASFGGSFGGELREQLGETVRTLPATGW